MSDHAEQDAVPVAGVKVFSTPACVQCKATYRALDAAGIPYEPFDVTTDSDAAQRARELGAALMTSGGKLQMPLVATEDGQVWAGYKPDRIREHATRIASGHDVPQPRTVSAGDRARVLASTSSPSGPGDDPPTATLSTARQIG